MNKENKTSDEQRHGNDFIAFVKSRFNELEDRIKECKFMAEMVETRDEEDEYWHEKYELELRQEELGRILNRFNAL